MYNGCMSTTRRRVSDRESAPVWSQDPSAVMKALGSGPAGLAERDVRSRRKKDGANELPSGIRLTGFSIVVRQFKSPLIILLVIAGGVTIWLRELVDAVVIFLAVAVNTALGFWQEYKAESVLNQLKSYIRTRARVRRGGREMEIDASDLVTGDVIRLALGDRVPADARIVHANQLSIDESVLTGESLPILKNETAVLRDAVLGDRFSMVWSGTLVVEGVGEAIVTATGSRSEFGRIAALTAKQTPEETPLQHAVARFAAIAGLSIAVLAALLFIGGVVGGAKMSDMFVLAVAVAVSAVPEGLPIALTVIFAVGVERLARRKGVVRRMIAAETLGSTNVILTDKTGTLTMARMSLVAVLPALGTSAEAEERLLQDAISVADVMIENSEAEPAQWKIIGKPMEAAVVRGAAERGIFATKTVELARTPFNSTRKYSSATIRVHGKVVHIVVGAPEIVVGMCAGTGIERGRLIKEIDRRASSGERLLGVARFEGEAPVNGAGVFQGLLAFRDPVRASVPEAIRRMIDAGVRTIIVTGDHPGTAESVAREIGILSKTIRGVMTGAEMAKRTDAELNRMLDSTAVFARVTPEQKMDLVKRFRAKGAIVAVTGDGVNDAPALEAADIGVAVGSGTDVAKSAADLVLLDDDFSTLVAAVEEGRHVRQNVRKVIVYLLYNAFDELVLIAGSMLLGIPIPINALQILFVNFFSDSFPAIAFAFERNDADRLSVQPTALSRSVFDRGMRFLIFAIGLPTGILLFVTYAALLRSGADPVIVRTFIYASFSVSTLFVAFSLRSLRQSLFHMHPFGNRQLAIGVGFGMILTIAGVYVPMLQSVLHTVALPFPWAMAVLGMAFVNVLVMDFAKLRVARLMDRSARR